MKLSKIVCTIALICLATGAFAQKNIINQHLFWATHSVTFDIDSSNWQIKKVIEERVYWFPWQQHQLLIGVAGVYKLPKGWYSAAGFTFFMQTVPQNPDLEVTSNNPELRPLMEMGNTVKINKRLSVSNRYRAEFRFFQKPSGGFKFNSVRFRAMVQLRIQVVDKLSLYLFDELHVNAGKAVINNIFNQNRVGGGIVLKATPWLAIDLGYLNWYQQLGTGFQRFNRHIFKIGIVEKFQIHRKQK